MTPEFPYPVRLDAIGTAPRRFELEAGPAQREALARRFDLIALDVLEAGLDVRAEAGGARVTGRVTARGYQPCGLSGAPVNFSIDEAVDLRFVTAGDPAGDEVELSDGDLDVLPVEAGGIDLGEAAAQTLGLALDPYPRAAGAELPPAVVAEDKVVPLKRTNPFGVLKGE